VVPCANNHGRVLGDRRRTSAGHPREPHTEVLQPSQTTSRLGEPRVPRSRRFGSGFVGRGYLRREIDYTIFEGHG
jgi:hypothetical protein